MPLPDWNNDKASPPKAWSPCSPDPKELTKIGKAIKLALLGTDMGATIAGSAEAATFVPRT